MPDLEAGVEEGGSIEESGGPARDVGSTEYPRIRQRSLELLHSRATDRSATEAKFLQAGQELQLRQPGIGDVSFPEVENAEVGQFMDVNEPGVGEAGAAEPEFPELRQ